jgi:hypothetical protein
MVRLRTAEGPFHAKVIAARLGAEGIVCQLRGAVDGPYPAIGDVYVYVDEDDVADASEVLLADDVEAALSVIERDTDDEPAHYTRLYGWMPLAAAAVAACTAVASAL